MSKLTFGPHQQAALDRVGAATALVDPSGVIVAVNAAWRDFGDQNGLDDPAYCVGEDYTQWDTPRLDAHTRRAAEGLLAVVRGQRAAFSAVYPCHAPHEQRWYRFLVVPVTASAPRPVVAVHVRLDDDFGAQEHLRELSDEAVELLAASIELPVPTVCAWCCERELAPDGTWTHLPGGCESVGHASHGICPDCLDGVMVSS